MATTPPTRWSWRCWALSEMDMGTLRRAPRLWEQQVQQRLNTLAAGEPVVSGPVSGAELQGSDPLEPDPEVPTTLLPPSAPRLDKGIGSVVVSWDGLDNTGQPYPVTATVEVHVSLTQNFTPSATTRRGLVAAGGTSTVDGLQTFDPPRPYWFRLVGVDQQGGTAASVSVSGFPGVVVATDIGEGTITYDKVSFNARTIGGVTTGIGTTLPPIATVLEPPNGALLGDTFLLKVTNPPSGGQPGVTALKQYVCDGTKWNPVEWGTDAFSARCISALQIVAGSITADVIATKTILADNIATGTIKADSACIGSLDASKITTGVLNANLITATGTIRGASIETPRAPNNSFIQMGNTSGTENEDFIKFVTGANTVEGQIRANDNGMTLIPGDSPIRFDRGTAAGGRTADVVFNAPDGTGNWRININGLDAEQFAANTHDVLGLRLSDNRLVRLPNVTTPEPQIAALEERIAELESRLAAMEGSA